MTSSPNIVNPSYKKLYITADAYGNYIEMSSGSVLQYDELTIHYKHYPADQVSCWYIQGKTKMAEIIKYSRREKMSIASFQIKDSVVTSDSNFEEVRLMFMNGKIDEDDKVMRYKWGSTVTIM